jgi:hypothetical protein
LDLAKSYQNDKSWRISLKPAISLNFPFLSLIKRFFPTNYGFNKMRIFMRIAKGDNYEYSPVNLT